MKLKNEEKLLWDKVILNSCYEPKGFDTFILYDETICHQVTEECKKNLILLQEIVKNV